VLVEIERNLVVYILISNNQSIEGKPAQWFEGAKKLPEIDAFVFIKVSQFRNVFVVSSN
jgi:hypothetical protein